MIELRDYQETSVDLVLKEYEKDPHGDAYLVLPCGAGKTIVFSAVIDALARAHGLSALVLAHRDVLLDQAADKYRKIDPTAIIGKVNGKHKEYGAPITVASINTISQPRHIKRLRALYGTGEHLIIVIDECHHVMSEGYQRLLKELPDAFVFGVTATPDRLDKKQIFDGKKPLFSMSIIDGIKRKFLCDMRVIAIKTETILDLKDGRGDYNEKELDLAVNTPERNRLIAEKYKEYANGKRTICFAVTVAHAQALAYAFNDQGIPAAAITERTSDDERKRLYEALRLGEILVLISILVLTEGFDEPSVECVIWARPTKSRSLFIQGIGRCLRLFPGKLEGLILDITDNCLKHRLMPVNLRKALDFMNLKDDESIEEALAREEEEAEERERIAQVRKLTEKRVRDLQLNLLESITWTEHDGGLYWSVELPRLKHRLAIIPTKNETERYYVAARPYLDGRLQQAQKWSGALTLEECQQMAEKRALEILAEPERIHIYDAHANWHHNKISEKQIKWLKWHKMSYDANMTKDEASRLIGQRQKEIDERKAATAARKAAKTLA